ncbi:TIGR00730 family Rossman fold protein [Porifericola rhodea]|uniref:LOG family protein n=1 Tax=Porifericola rhodea TaxID=930972 RepID=UPI00266706AB|nr:TIGR00730 family Rossman fold protein [Porifericola rhodea]WKN30882.1 TIGR00730 family Rossman fold protein [Porifericola rhodea]
MKSIAVFCASKIGEDSIYHKVASEVGRMLAEENIRLIYGGGKVGLMGAVADAALEAGGEVIGVIPYFLDKKEVGHQGLTELIRVESMHERKMKMSELSEGVITLAGGFGTLEELTEMLTWSQLALHHKPIGILNTNGYYDYMEKLFDHMCEEGFLAKETRKIAIFEREPEHLFNKMRSFVPEHLTQHLDRDKT